MAEYKIDRFSFGTTVKIFFLGLVPISFFLGVFFGLSALFGQEGSVVINGKSVTGIWGLFAGPIVTFIISGIFSVIGGTLCWLGHYLLNISGIKLNIRSIE